MTDGKAQRPEESAQREARSEPIPTPEGQGGGEREEAMALAARIVEEYTMYDFGMSPANELKLARALLSSPRVEEVRREAFEEAAKVLEDLAIDYEKRAEESAAARHYSTAAYQKRESNSLLHAVHMVRSLSPQGG